MYQKLEKISQKPLPYEEYTAESLWAENYRAKRMLMFHLDEHIDAASRNRVFIDNSAAWIADTFCLSAGAKVCDFGCGPGLYTSRFAEKGAIVTGIDFSKNSIEYANNEAAKLNLDITYIHSNYLDARLQGPYDLITMIMCDFCALSPNQRKELLSTFDRVLGPNGKVLLDVYSMVAFENKDEVSRYEKNQLNHFWFEEDYYAFVNTYKYPEVGVILDKYSLFTEGGVSETVYNWLKYFGVDELKDELVDSGFSAQSVYADICGSDYDPAHSEFAVVIKRT